MTQNQNLSEPELEAEVQLPLLPPLELPLPPLASPPLLVRPDGGGLPPLGFEGPV